jgi:hypothetical protein
MGLEAARDASSRADSRPKVEGPAPAVAEQHFNVRNACVMVVAAKPARGRPRRFGAAVGCADCPAALAWRITRYALRAALGQMR